MCKSQNGLIDGGGCIRNIYVPGMNKDDRIIFTSATLVSFVLFFFFFFFLCRKFTLRKHYDDAHGNIRYSSRI